jgi:BirA family transcriptional regulator, biotin operon repressor / biotin---[acetyl-CoA-carboxylase] ligase
VADFLARREHFAVVGSTNDVVRGWLADGTPEVCLAVADEQTAGRGREGRTWRAPPGAALLLSLGFRPDWLEPERAWRLAAMVSMAMAEAAERVASLSSGSIRSKWPNDLVIEMDPGIRKIAGVLGETDGLGTDDPRVVIGIGVNGDWPADAFPIDLADTMTSLCVLAGRAIDHDELLTTFLERLERAIRTLRDGGFDEAGWASRQVTTGRWVRIEFPDGNAEELPAVGVDARSGALLVIDPAVPDVRRHVLVGEVRHVRLASAMASRV